MTPPRPVALEVWSRNIPKTLKSIAGWVMWRYEFRPGNGTRPGKWTKPPYNIDGIKIDEGDPNNWVDFSTALQTYQKGGFDGIGISTNALESLVGWDLDHSVKDGAIAAWALAVVEEMKSYAEISPSGTGLRIFGYGKLRREGRKRGDCEVYDSGRYLTVTGHKLDAAAYDLEDIDEATDRVHRRIWPEMVEGPKEPLREESGESGGDLADRFQALLDDDLKFRSDYYSPANVGHRSDHEYHLCAKLWEEGFSASEIRSLMDSSPQEKWQSRDDKYREDTIQNAIQRAGPRKSPRQKENPVDLLDILEKKLIEDPGIISDPTVKKMLAKLSKLDKVAYEALLKRAGIKGDMKKALASDVKRIQKDGDDEDGGNRGPSMATRITELAVKSGAKFWRTPEGDPFATIPSADGHFENHPIKSRAIRDWLSDLLYREDKRVPKGSAVADSISVLSGKARFDGEIHPVFVRFAEYEGKIYLDLGGGDWRAVEIGADGWRIISSSEVPVKFRRAKGFLELPEPEAGGSLEDLRKILNIPEGSPWMLIEGWLMQSFNPHGPYPILVVDGEQGSGKSWLGRILRGVVDPNKSPLRRPPKSDRDLMIAASNSWLVVYDNLSGLPPWLGDAFCVISTGGGLACRELYTDDEEAIFDVQRPQILNSIDELTSRPDLLDRAILLSLPRIKDGDRKTEEEIEAELERIRPGVIGAILDVISKGLKALPSVKLASKPRMADFAVWAVACGEALGWDDGAFLEAFKENQKAAKKTLIENDMFATSLYEFITGGDGPFEDSISFLLTVLEGRSGITAATRPDGWPKTARWASGRIRRIAPALRDVGIDVSFPDKSHGIRKIRIEQTGGAKQEELVLAPPVAPPGETIARDQTGGARTLGALNSLILTLDEDIEKNEEKKEREEREGKDRKTSVLASIAPPCGQKIAENGGRYGGAKDSSAPQNTPPSSVEISEAREIAEALESQGKRITFGNVEACLEEKAGEYVEPREVKKVLNALSLVGYSTSREGVLTRG